MKFYDRFGRHFLIHGSDSSGQAGHYFNLFQPFCLVPSLLAGSLASLGMTPPGDLGAIRNFTPAVATAVTMPFFGEDGAAA